MPTIARIAAVVAFIIAGGMAVAALLGPASFILLPFALIPLTAGIGIVRRRAWSSYGFALFEFARLLLLPFVLFGPDSLPIGLPRIIATAAVPGALGVLFLFAGRSLAAVGSERGRAWPWIAVSAVTTLPLFFVRAFVVRLPRWRTPSL